MIYFNYGIYKYQFARYCYKAKSRLQQSRFHLVVVEIPSGSSRNLVC